MNHPVYMCVYCLLNEQRTYPTTAVQQRQHVDAAGRRTLFSGLISMSVLNAPTWLLVCVGYVRFVTDTSMSLSNRLSRKVTLEISSLLLLICRLFKIEVSELYIYIYVYIYTLARAAHTQWNPVITKSVYTTPRL